MNLDDILELAAAHQPSALDRARSRRAAERVLQEYAKATAEGRNLLGDLDVEDVLGPHSDEASRIKRAAESVQAGWVRWDASSRELTWSDEMSRMFGYPAVTTNISTAVLAQGIHPEDRATVRAAVEDGWEQRKPVEVTFRLLRADGLVRYVQCLVELLSEDGQVPTGIIATAHDVTRRELDRQEHSRRRRRDRTGADDQGGHAPVSGLVGRDHFSRALDTASRGGSGALLVISVEAARALPAELAEQVIQTVAGLLGRIVLDDDLCGVLSPSEFGVLFRDVETATEAATSIHHQLALTTAGGVRLRAWGGFVAFTRDDVVSGHDLLLDAVWAGRQGRRRRPSALSVLAGPRPARARADAVRNEVNAAILANRLCLYAQPILDLTLNEITQHEVLLRVLNEADQPEPPAAFLAMAERGNEILTVDRWVVEHSLAVIGQGPQTARYQINLSGRTLSSRGLAEFVLRSIEKHEVDPRTITFEITESAAIDDLDAAAAFAGKIRSQGCELALDDFGTGYSSLLILKRLPIDQVKIDGEFIAGLRDSEFDRIAVRIVVDMCRALGIRTTAEFVGDATTIDMLRDLGVDFAQGFAVARPQPMPSVTAGMAPIAPPTWDRAIG